MKKKYKIAIPGLNLDKSKIPKEVLEQCELIEGNEGNPEGNAQLFKTIKDADAVVFNSSHNISMDVMKSAPNLKIAFKSGAWPENIDFEYAKNNNIAVGWTPLANVQSVAEYTVMLILAAQKKFLHAANSFAQGEWRNQSHIGRNLQDKTIGLIGLGAIGIEVSKILKGFNTKIIGYDPFQDEKIFKRTGITKVTFDELLNKADIISIHCLLTDDTRMMFNKNTFNKMKSDSILINSARGGMINESDLIEALQTKQIGGAALDVFEKEPLSMKSKLRNLDNVTLTPHVAAFAEESTLKELVWPLQGALSYLKGEKVTNATVVDPNN